MTKQECFLDTCVVFNLMKPYRVYEYGGEKELEDYQHKLEIDLANKIKQLKALGVSYGFTKEISKESLADLADLIEKKSAELHQISQKANKAARRDYSYFLDLKEAFLNNVTKINSIKLFKKMLNGEVVAFLTPMTLAEIKHHTKYKNEPGYSGGKSFNSEIIVPFINQYLTTIYVEDKRIQKVVAHLSEVLRGKTSKTTKLNTEVMANDLNSLGEYGDSTIMAEAMLFGKNLITENAKDFISDNSAIRDFVRTLNTDIIKHVSNALPYSVSEFLNGEAANVTKQTSFITLQDNSIENHKFSINKQEAIFDI